MLFRVLRGAHAEGKYPEGHPWAGRTICYDRGEIVDSKSNLARFNSNGPLGPKFQRIYDPNAVATDKIGIGRKQAEQEAAARVYDDGNGPHGPNTPMPVQLPEDGLEEMTVAELKELAVSEEIELPAKATKDQIIEVIRTVYA